MRMIRATQVGPITTRMQHENTWVHHHTHKTYDYGTPAATLTGLEARSYVKIRAIKPPQVPTTRTNARSWINSPSSWPSRRHHHHHNDYYHHHLLTRCNWLLSWGTIIVSVMLMILRIVSVIRDDEWLVAFSVQVVRHVTSTFVHHLLLFFSCGGNGAHKWDVTIVK